MLSLNISFAHFYSLLSKYSMSNGAAKRGQDVQGHRQGQSPPKPEKEFERTSSLFY